MFQVYPGDLCVNCSNNCLNDYSNKAVPTGPVTVVFQCGQNLKRGSKNSPAVAPLELQWLSKQSCRLAGQEGERRLQQEKARIGPLSLPVVSPLSTSQGSPGRFPNVLFTAILCHDLASASTPTDTPGAHSPPQCGFSRAGCPTHLERLQSPHITRSSQIVTGGEQWPSISSQVIHRFIASLSGQSGMVSVQCCS